MAWYTNIRMHTRLHNFKLLMVSILLSACASASAQWSRGVPIDPSQTGALFHPRCCADKFGNVHALIMDKREGVYRTFYTKFDGNSWTAPVNISSGIYDSDYCDIACDSAGNVHVVFDGHPTKGASYRVYYKTWPAGEYPGAGQTDISGGSVAAVRPQLAVDSAGKVHCVYYDLNGSGVYYVNNVSGAWSTPYLLNSTGYYPAVAVGPDDTCHIVFQERGTGQYNIYYKKRTVTGSWSGRRLTSAPADVDYETPAIALDSIGNILVVYRRDDVIPYRLWGHKWTAPNGPWIELPYLGGSGSMGAWPRIDVDRNGLFHIVAQSGSPYDIYYCFGDITTITRSSLVAGGVPNQQTPDVACSPSGQVTVIWQDTAEGRVYYSVTTSFRDFARIKTLSDGVSVWTAPKTVTAAFANFFYVSELSGLSGIRVNSSQTVAEGTLVEVVGTTTTVDGERCIDASRVTPL